MISGLHTLSYGRAMVVMPPKSDAFHVKWVSFHTWLSQQFTVKIWFFSSTSDKKRERLSCCCLDRGAAGGVRVREEAFACKNEEQIVLLPKKGNKRELLLGMIWAKCHPYQSYYSCFIFP